jgi:TrmH RNA methyltransferase
MTTQRPPGGNSPYRGPLSWRNEAPRREPEMEPAPPRAKPAGETRVFGLNACLALFARRPQDVRKVWLMESRVGALKPVLAWCVKNRLGYRVVQEDDLDKLTSTQHHEGVCFDVLRRPPLTVTGLLAAAPREPEASLLILLDGVGNPHNVGALLRSAANFGAHGLILSPDAPATLSGATCRVAEGGAEVVPLAQAGTDEDVLPILRKAGYRIAATTPRDGVGLFDQALPERLVLIFGAESEGIGDALIRAADLRLTIPGTGEVESLNISASAAVLFAEWWRSAR